MFWEQALGLGIAYLMAQNGVQAILVDVDDAILKRSIGNIENLLNKRVAKGKNDRRGSKGAFGPY